MIKKIFNTLFGFIYGYNIPSKEEARFLLDQLQQEQQLQQLHSNTENPNVETQIDSVASITFFIDPIENNIHIKYNWNVKDEITARQMAQMLFYINDGQLEKGCAIVLQEYAKRKSKDQTFIKNIFDNWKKVKEESEIIVKPSEVFRLGSNRHNREYHNRESR